MSTIQDRIAAAHSARAEEEERQRQREADRVVAEERRVEERAQFSRDVEALIALILKAGPMMMVEVEAALGWDRDRVRRVVSVERRMKRVFTIDPLRYGPVVDDFFVAAPVAPPPPAEKQAEKDARDDAAIVRFTDPTAF